MVAARENTRRFLFNDCSDDGDEDSEMMDKVNKVYIRELEEG